MTNNSFEQKKGPGGMTNAEIINQDSFERLKSKNQRKGAVRRAFYIITALVVCGVFAFVCGMLFFKIENIEVEGTEFYSADDISVACDFSESQSLLFLNTNALITKLSNQFPYIKSISLKRSFPSTLVIQITEDSPKYYCDVFGENFLLSDKLKIMERHFSYDAANYSAKLVKIDIPDYTRVIVGEYVAFQRESNYEYVIDFLNEMSDFAYKDDIEYIDSSDKYGIYLIMCDGRYKVILGDSNDLSAKLSFVEAVIKSSFDETSIASINVEYVDSVIVSLGDKPFSY